MHLFKHVVESRGANTARRCHEEVVQVVYIETGLSGKKKSRSERKWKERKKDAEECIVGCYTGLRGGNSRQDKRVVPLCSYFLSCPLWCPSRLQAFWVRDCLLYTVLHTVLLSTPTIQIITQQKLMYIGKGWKSNPSETLGKLEITPH